MNKKQLTDTIGQVIRDLELAEKRVLELEDEVARLYDAGELLREGFVEG